MSNIIILSFAMIWKRCLGAVRVRTEASSPSKDLQHDTERSLIDVLTILHHVHATVLACSSMQTSRTSQEMKECNHIHPNLGLDERSY